MPKLLPTDPDRINERIRWRARGGLPRAYGEFRDFSDVGGGQIALKLAGERFATSHPEVARQLAAGILAAFKKWRALRPTVPAGVRTVGAYVD